MVMYLKLSWYWSSEWLEEEYGSKNATPTTANMYATDSSRMTMNSMDCTMWGCTIMRSASSPDIPSQYESPLKTHTSKGRPGDEAKARHGILLLTFTACNTLRTIIWNAPNLNTYTMIMTITVRDIATCIYAWGHSPTNEAIHNNCCMSRRENRVSVAMKGTV